MDITPKKRSKTITVHEFGNMTQKEIAAECRVSLGAVNNIIRKKNERGSISPQRKGRCGRKRKHPRKMMPISSELAKLILRRTVLIYKRIWRL